MNRQGIADDELRAGIMALAGGESDLHPRSESSYCNTANARIRAIFGARVSALEDVDLDELKADDERFFNRVYGGEWGRNHLGNTELGDGYRFRGRGVLQLTGRANYARYARLTGFDLVNDPDLANDKRAAAAIAVAYMRDHYKGGGWPAMKRAVGKSFGNVDAAKDALFARYRATGEFSMGVVPQATEGAAREALKDVQRALPDYAGPADGEFGPASRQALNQLLERAGQQRIA